MPGMLFEYVLLLFVILRTLMTVFLTGDEPVIISRAARLLYETSGRDEGIIDIALSNDIHE